MKKKYIRGRSASVVGASTVGAMLFVSGAIAQQNVSDKTIEEVLVIGTLISRSAYEAPTPVSALDEESFRQMPVTQIDETVAWLPVFQCLAT